MKAAVVVAPDELVVREVPMPKMGAYDALVRIEVCSLCNSTDVKIIERELVSHIPLPLVLGHESVGTVVEVGRKGRCYKVGQRVLRPGVRYDPSRVRIASAWGGLAQYGLVTDRAAWCADHPGKQPGGMWAKEQVIPDDIDPGEATAIITLKETLFATRALGIDETTRTAIVGTGPVARAFTFWARRMNPPFLAVFGRREKWRQSFLDLGADNYVVAGRTSLEGKPEACAPGSFDRVIEAVGSTEALESALALARADGLVGNYGVAPEGDVGSDQIRAARQTGRIFDLPVREEEVHEELLNLIEKGKVVLADWISHRLPLANIHEGLRLLRNKKAVKVVIEL